MTLKLVYDNETGFADCVVENGRYVVDNGLVTFALITLFTNARANETEVEPGQDREGWWAEPLLNLGTEPFGSKLWLLEDGKNTETNAANARQWAEDAFEWWITARLADRVVVEADRDAEILCLIPNIFKPENPRPEVIGPWEAFHRAA